MANPLRTIWLLLAGSYANTNQLADAKVPTRRLELRWLTSSLLVFRGSDWEIVPIIYLCRRLNFAADANRSVPTGVN